MQMQLHTIFWAALAWVGMWTGGQPCYAQLNPELCYRGAVEGQFDGQALSSLAFGDGVLYAVGYTGQRSLFKIDVTDLHAPGVTRLADTDPLIGWPDYSGLSGVAVDAAGDVHMCGSKYYGELRSPPLVWRSAGGTLASYTALDELGSIWSGLDRWDANTLLAGSGASDGAPIRLYPLSTQTLDYASPGCLEMAGSYMVNDVLCVQGSVFASVHNYATGCGEIVKFAGGTPGRVEGYTGSVWATTPAHSDYGYYPNGLGYLSDGEQDFIVWCNFYTSQVEIYGRANRELLRTLGPPDGVIAPPRDACMGRIGDRTFLFVSHAAGNGFSSGIYVYELAPSMKTKMTAGRSVQIDDAFTYYKNRSAESIASEVALNGFNNVLYMMFDERRFSADWIDAFHRWGVGVWAGFPATSFYTPTDLFPAGSSAWRIQYLDPNYMASYTGNFSFVHQDYREWYKGRLRSIFDQFAFDGFLFFEAFYSNLGALQANPVRYGDVSPAFQAAFKSATGNTAFPNFTNPADPHYYQTDTALYQDLIDYRIQAIDDFYDDIVNGPGGVRSFYPGLVVGTWTLGGSWNGALAQMQEEEGQDSRRMVQAVQPDIHYVQSHYPDWASSSLAPDYVTDYAPFVAAARQSDPTMPVGVQTDIGSLSSMIRSKEWYEQFVTHAALTGVDATTYYMLNLRGEVHTQAPQVRLLRQAEDPCRLAVYFDQVVDPASALAMAGRTVADADSPQTFAVQSAQADGNIIWLTLAQPPPLYMRAVLPVGGVADWPSVRFHGGYPQNAIAQDTAVTMTLLGPSRGAARAWGHYQ